MKKKKKKLGRSVSSPRREKMYDELFSRSFSKNDQRKLSRWALAVCFVMALSLCAILNSYITPLSISNLERVNNLNLKLSDQRSSQEDSSIDESITFLKPSLPIAKEIFDQVQVKKLKPICNFSLLRTDFCEITGDVRVQGSSSAVFVSPSLIDDTEKGSETAWKLRPYARKTDGYVLKKVKEIAVGSPLSLGLKEMPKCSINHTVPAIVFSTGGYAGNHFHEFSDILVPLYITARPFDGEVQFIVTDIKRWWFIKHKPFLSSLSKYPVVDMDGSKDVNCFPSIIVGLKGHKEFGIDPSQTRQGYSMESFTQFVRSAYSLKRNIVQPLNKGGVGKPRLLVVSRKRSRSIINENEVAEEARRIGFEVSIVEAKRNLQDFSRIVNSCDVMLGVHGAGLTNSVFLPKNAVLIQVVPLGLEWISKHDFHLPADAMGLKYMEYRVSWKESSLAEKFSADDPVIRNPRYVEDWFEFKKIYLDGQNVRIDVKRFRNTLLKALDLLRK